MLIKNTLVALNQAEGAKTIPIFDLFPEGTLLEDGYSGIRTTVLEGRVSLTTPYALVLLSTPAPSGSKGLPPRNWPASAKPIGNWRCSPACVPSSTRARAAARSHLVSVTGALRESAG